LRWSRTSARWQGQQAGEFTDEMTPIEVVERTPNLATGEVITKTRTVSLDEGPRPDTSLEGLAKLRPVFAATGQRDGRQQLADQRRRRRADPGQREGRQAVQPDAAGALRQLRRARRAARDHGHRPDRGHSRRAALRRPQAASDIGWSS
jgi:acetyl-CoA acetyltransferase